MSVYGDMARDAGYTGDEARQAAAQLEEQERQAYEELEAQAYAEMEDVYYRELEERHRGR